MKKNNIIILTDYKNFFNTKQKSNIYRGGFDEGKIKIFFKINDYNVSFINISNCKANEIPQDSYILYQSSEDHGGFYKSFIEDIILNLELSGHKVIPKYEYLRAHNNKVFMELLRARTMTPEINSIKSIFFGTLEELKECSSSFLYPVVIKSSYGAMSKGVAKANNYNELLSLSKSISRSFSFKHDIKELLRKIKYGKKYYKESFHRNKFVVQNLIENLENDWKVLVYGNKCFILHRKNRENDFRASGSGNFIFKKEIPDGILDYALRIRKLFHVPNISLDIGFDGERFHLIEFQFINFGTTTIEKSPFHFEKNESDWQLIESRSDLEETYVNSIVSYIEMEFGS